jgi:hypothetical protein
MQQALQLETVVDEGVVDALPALKPLLGHRVQMIALAIEPPMRRDADDKISVEEFLEHRLKRPAGMRTVSLEEMERAIIRGALGGDV